jgi:hypothetical protein
MSMTFLQLQDAVIGDRFDESDRTDVKTWINARYFWLWHLEKWSFRHANDTVTVTSGSNTITGIPTDFSRAVSILRSNGDPLQYYAPRRFRSLYYDATNLAVGPPAAYTVESGTFYCGPYSNETKSDYMLTYIKAFTALSADGDVPALPSGAHLGLVFGAAATGRKNQSDPTWQGFETDFNSVIAVLRSDYLTDETDDDGSYPADPF